MMLGTRVRPVKKNENYPDAEAGILVKKGYPFWYYEVEGRIIASYPEDLEVVE